MNTCTNFPQTLPPHVDAAQDSPSELQGSDLLSLKQNADKDDKMKSTVAAAG